jgi:F-type H+-transporting ATPase subunit delta
MCPAAHGMRRAEGDAGGIVRRRFSIGPAGAMHTGFPHLFPGESDHVSSDDPMMASMAGRYAVALFELAKDQGQLAQVEGDLATFQAMLDGSADLRRLVLSPVISAEDQGKALAAVLQMQGISGLTANFVKLIARNRRLFASSDMMKAFRALVARERGEVSAEVASAHALTPEQLQLLSDTLRTSIGKNVRIDTRVDPNLLAGLVVKVGSRMIDSSLRTKLNNLKVVMKGIG